MSGFHIGKFSLATSFGIAFFEIAMAVIVHPDQAFAYTQEEQQACTPDAMRLCGEFVPNVDAITACMIRKKAQLSPPCRVFFRSGPEEAAAPRAGHTRHHGAKKSTRPASKPSKKKATDT